MLSGHSVDVGMFHAFLRVSPISSHVNSGLFMQSSFLKVDRYQSGICLKYSCYSSQNKSEFLPSGGVILAVSQSNCPFLWNFELFCPLLKNY